MQDRIYIVSSLLKDEKTEVEAILCDVTHQDVRMIVQRLGTVTKGVLTLYLSCSIMLTYDNDHGVASLV